jgi:Ca-activated chloride channel homolog
MEMGTIRQLLLLTDGCSNTREDPAAMAAFALRQGITVNVIGIVDDSKRAEGLEEIESIARSGGGESRVVQARSLSETVVNVTRQAMTGTIYSIINQELRDILNEDARVESLPPEKRGKIAEKVEDISEEAELKLLVLTDMSASMKLKLPAVKEALYDLSVSMQSRSGHSSFSLWTFPGKYSAAEERIGWTDNAKKLAESFPQLASGGITPTGPAIRQALSSFLDMEKYDEKSI